jgi:ArsR family transcriptional regulator
MDGYELAALIMKALGHPARFQILEVLRREGEACVCHLEGLLNRPQAYISQHLARLREAGLVVDNRDGMNVYYQLTDDSLSVLLDEARRAAEVFAQVSGTRIEFSELSYADPEKCPCPKCREKALNPGATWGSPNEA